MKHVETVCVKKPCWPFVSPWTGNYYFGIHVADGYLTQQRNFCYSADRLGLVKDGGSVDDRMMVG